MLMDFNQLGKLRLTGHLLAEEAALASDSVLIRPLYNLHKLA